MTSIFSESASPTQSSEAELAALAEANPDLAKAGGQPSDEPPASDVPADPAPSDAAEPSAADETAPEPAGDAKPPKPSHIARLSEENRGLKDAVEQLRGQLEAMQRMGVQQQPQPQAQQQNSQQQDGPPPDRNEDPLGYMAWLEKRVERNEQIQQATMLHQRVTNDYVAAAQRFTASNPDFPEAYQFLFQGRVAELRAQGWADDAIARQVQQEEFNIALGALRAGRDPAQQAFELAKARGFTKGAGKPAPVLADPALQEARRKAAVSLSDGGKPEKGGDLTLDDIANLKGAAQESALKKYEEKHHRRQSIFRE